jgi:cyclin-dependent kinase 8/11
MVSQEESDVEDCSRSRASCVTRVRAKLKDGSLLWLADKRAFASRKASQEPHDIIKELRILTTISHENVRIKVSRVLAVKHGSRGDFV